MSEVTETILAPVPVVLTIAGVDPSGGAGVLADVRTFVAFGCFPTASITSLTFQNTRRVFGAVNQSAGIVRAQVMPLLEDFKISGAKTGMLPTREVIAEVARLFRETELPEPVVDPVMRATSGDDLIDDDAVASVISELLPLARVVTPNIPEAERLTGLTIGSENDMRRAAKMIRAMGARAVLVKGGHLAAIRTADGRRQTADDRRQTTDDQQSVGTQHSALTPEAIDVLDNDGIVTVYREELVSGGEVHGSGCTLSAAIAACLAKGMSLEDSVRDAKRYVTALIRRSPGLGHGARPLL